MNDALLIENVPEYKQELVQSQLPDDWSTRGCVIDPRQFGLPAARARVYIIAWRNSKVAWRPDINLEDIIEALTASVIKDASIFFWKSCPQSHLSTAQVLRL